MFYRRFYFDPTYISNQRRLICSVASVRVKKHIFQIFGMRNDLGLTGCKQRKRVFRTELIHLM